MKNLFSFMLVIFFGLLLGLVFNTIEASSIESQNQKTPKQKVEAISKINRLIVKDTVNNAGLCDTCHTSYKTAIIENRILANQISAQNYAMSEIIKRNEAEISRLEMTAGVLVGLRKKYEVDISNIKVRMQNNKIFYSHAQPYN